MPCNCDHLEPSAQEAECKRVMGLLSEVGLYNQPIPLYGEVKKIHLYTAQLCAFCATSDVTKYSLELQIWWRDHQEADKARLEREKALRQAKLVAAAMTDEPKQTDIDSSFMGRNFGPAGKTKKGRKLLVADCVMKRACGFSTGSTIEQICKELGLLDEKGVPSKRDTMWAYHYISVHFLGTSNYK